MFPTLEGDSVVGCLEDGIPCMPTIPFERSHRPKHAHTFAPHALIVRPLNKKHIQADLVATASINKERKRLRDRKAWDESTVREWSDVAADARRASEEVHMSMLFGFVVEKTLTFPLAIPAVHLRVVLLFIVITL